MIKEKMMTCEEFSFVDEIKDFEGQVHQIYGGCEIKHYYFPEDQGIILHESEVTFRNQKIRTHSFCDDYKTIKACEDDLANYGAMEAQRRFDERRGK